MSNQPGHLDAALARYARVTLLEGATSIQRLSRLSALPELKGCQRYVKRDDLTGLGGGGKAFAGMLAAARRGDFPAGSNLLFVMTGGLPGIFAYRSTYE